MACRTSSPSTVLCISWNRKRLCSSSDTQYILLPQGLWTEFSLPRMLFLCTNMWLNPLFPLGHSSDVTSGDHPLYPCDHSISYYFIISHITYHHLVCSSHAYLFVGFLSSQENVSLRAGAFRFVYFCVSSAWLIVGTCASRADGQAAHVPGLLEPCWWGKLMETGAITGPLLLIALQGNAKRSSKYRC